MIVKILNYDINTEKIVFLTPLTESYHTNYDTRVQHFFLQFNVHFGKDFYLTLRFEEANLKPGNKVSQEFKTEIQNLKSQLSSVLSESQKELTSKMIANEH